MPCPITSAQIRFTATRAKNGLSGFVNQSAKAVRRSCIVASSSTPSPGSQGFMIWPVRGWRTSPSRAT